MKTKIYHLLCLLFVFTIIAACSKEEETPASITIAEQSQNQILASGINSRITVDFTSTHDWKASTDASWAVITPTSGKAGTASIGILAKEENRTGEVRTGLLTLIVRRSNCSSYFYTSGNGCSKYRTDRL